MIASKLKAVINRSSKRQTSDSTSSQTRVWRQSIRRSSQRSLRRRRVKAVCLHSSSSPSINPMLACAQRTIYDFTSLQAIAERFRGSRPVNYRAKGLKDLNLRRDTMLVQSPGPRVLWHLLVYRVRCIRISY